MQKRPRRRILVLPIVAAVLAAGVAFVAGAPAAVSATTKTVNIVEFAYSPSSVTVNVGDTVKWSHDSSSVPHSVTADDGSFDSSPNCPSACLGANSTYSHTFTKAGTFHYHCRIHGSEMTGVVIVKGAVSAPTIKSLTPTSEKHGTTNDKVTIVGSQFATGVKVKVSGTGVTVSAVHRTDAAHLTVTLSVASSAAKTSRSVTVTNTDGGTATKSAALTIT